MKQITYHKDFTKNYNKRIKGNLKLEKLVDEKIKLFHVNRLHPSLDDHKLSGNLRPRMAFRIKSDLRIIYTEHDTYFAFLDIGTHNQVY